uniref:Uncharacterized protein n=1 Tax=Brassica oleracea var. oleracea TaxID=109376 RepID=A0A0D3AZZ1_BRAOL
MLENQGEDEFGEGLKAKNRVKETKVITKGISEITALNWIAWFPFLLLDTDWMGREVYGGDSGGNEDLKRLYNQGVHAGWRGMATRRTTWRKWMDHHRTSSS